jgi:hypothetical protein
MAGLLPRVGLILTGGTIDSVGTDRLDLAWYIEACSRAGDTLPSSSEPSVA